MLHHVLRSLCESVCGHSLNRYDGSAHSYLLEADRSTGKESKQCSAVVKPNCKMSRNTVPLRIVNDQIAAWSYPTLSVFFGKWFFFWFAHCFYFHLVKLQSAGPASLWVFWGAEGETSHRHRERTRLRRGGLDFELLLRWTDITAWCAEEERSQLCFRSRC